MMVRGKIKKGSYYDSITLMRVGKAVAALEGVTDAAVVMGTQTNKGILGASGLYLSDFDASGDTDLLIAVKSETEAVVEKAMAEVENQLQEAMKKKSAGGAAVRPLEPGGIHRGPPGREPGHHLRRRPVRGRRGHGGPRTRPARHAVFR